MSSTPGFGFGYDILSWAYHELGERDKAIAAAVNKFRVSLNFPEGALAFEKAYADGDYSGAYLHAAKILEERSKTVHVGPLAIGELYEFSFPISSHAESRQQPSNIRCSSVQKWVDSGHQVSGSSQLGLLYVAWMLY
jgi:hypothetical protein